MDPLLPGYLIIFMVKGIFFKSDLISARGLPFKTFLSAVLAKIQPPMTMLTSSFQSEITPTAQRQMLSKYRLNLINMALYTAYDLLWHLE